MAWYNTKTNRIEFFPDRASQYKGWLEIDCGCCAGIQWGGEVPRECKSCMGNGILFKHIKSGVLAEYPGGKLRGRM